jgi:Na+/melibiose symporter-like transporter
MIKKLEPLKKSTILAYGMGSLGNNIIYAFISTYLLVFYTESFGLKAASIGTLFLVARIWDGFNDPIMGIIVDNTETRWGKFRPYLLCTFHHGRYNYFVFFESRSTNTFEINLCVYNIHIMGNEFYCNGYTLLVNVSCIDN